MSYHDILVGLSRECERQVLAVYAAYAAGDISTDEAQVTIAGIIAAHNSKAVALADLSLAATIMLSLRREEAVLGLLPAVDDVVRLQKAAATVLTVAEDSEVPEAIVGRLARSEPLETAARAYSEAMNKSAKVTGWVRNLSGDSSCQLCVWWWRAGKVWDADHEMPTHKGCTCTPQPVVSDESRRTP